MEIKKVTEKYTFYQEGINYVLDIGKKKLNEDTTTELLITGIEDSEKLLVKSTCGCSTAQRTIIDKNTQSVKVSYNECSASFAKILEILYQGVKIGTIKLKGTCS